MPQGMSAALSSLGSSNTRAGKVPTLVPSHLSLLQLPSLCLWSPQTSPAWHLHVLAKVPKRSPFHLSQCLSFHLAPQPFALHPLHCSRGPKSSPCHTHSQTLSQSPWVCPLQSSSSCPQQPPLLSSPHPLSCNSLSLTCIPHSPVPSTPPAQSPEVHYFSPVPCLWDPLPPQAHPLWRSSTPQALLLPIPTPAPCMKRHPRGTWRKEAEGSRRDFPFRPEGSCWPGGTEDSCAPPRAPLRSTPGHLFALPL